MTIIGGPIEILITFVLAAGRFGTGRTLLVTLALMPLYLYSLPPTSCGCMPALFRRCDRTKPYVAAMKSDLKNLASQQEIYFSDYERYSADPEDLSFVTSYGVHVTIHATDGSWAATATHEALSGDEGCAIWYGGDEPVVTDGLIGEGAAGELACS